MTLCKVIEDYIYGEVIVYFLDGFRIMVLVTFVNNVKVP